MKIRNFTLMAIASTMAFVSCSKEGANGPQDERSRAVTVKLGNPDLRSLQPQTTSGATAKLSKAQVFFFDGSGNTVTLATDYETPLYYETNPSGESGNGDIATLTGDDGVVFHNLPKSVEKVVITGNLNKTTTTSLSKLKDVTVNLVDQLDVDNLVMFGESSTLEPIGTDNENHTNYYKATVELTPLISRIEITEVTCSDLGEIVEDKTPMYSQLDITQIAIAGFHSTGSLGGVNTKLLAKISDEGNGMNEFLGIETATTAKPAYCFDMLTGENTITLTQDAKSKTFTTATDAPAAYAYHVFPGTVPQIMLNMEATPVDASSAQPRYIAAEKYTGDNSWGDASVFKPGYIYKVKFIFTEPKVGQFDTKCIMVIASITPWQITTLTPNFD